LPFTFLLFTFFYPLPFSFLLMKCPNCGKPTVWQDNPHRPFCSERCKLIDFGKWADEEYRVPAETSQPFESANEDEARPAPEDKEI
jgi:endogenous inhibitor of DNA gyrase (YacG/DUF329 family)